MGHETLRDLPSTHLSLRALILRSSHEYLAQFLILTKQLLVLDAHCLSLLFIRQAQPCFPG